MQPSAYLWPGTPTAGFLVWCWWCCCTTRQDEQNRRCAAWLPVLETGAWNALAIGSSSSAAQLRECVVQHNTTAEIAAGGAGAGRERLCAPVVSLVMQLQTPRLTPSNDWRVCVCAGTFTSDWPTSSDQCPPRPALYPNASCVCVLSCQNPACSQ